jgi:hypothetical protein
MHPAGLSHRMYNFSYEVIGSGLVDNETLLCQPIIEHVNIVFQILVLLTYMKIDFKLYSLAVVQPLQGKHTE